MRLFIATPVQLPLYGYIKEKISPFLEGKWISHSNLHITHYFIGEGEPDDYRFDLNIPDEKIQTKELNIIKERILYLRVFSKQISLPYKKISKKLGIKREKFLPHITLCRIKSIKDTAKLNEEMKKIKISYEIPFEVYLYSSKLTPKGAVYKRLYRY